MNDWERGHPRPHERVGEKTFSFQKQGMPALPDCN